MIYLNVTGFSLHVFSDFSLIRWYIFLHIYILMYFAWYCKMVYISSLRPNLPHLPPIVQETWHSLSLKVAEEVILMAGSAKWSPSTISSFVHILKRVLESDFFWAKEFCSIFWYTLFFSFVKTCFTMVNNTWQHLLSVPFLSVHNSSINYIYIVMQEISRTYFSFRKTGQGCFASCFCFILWSSISYQRYWLMCKIVKIY